MGTGTIVFFIMNPLDEVHKWQSRSIDIGKATMRAIIEHMQSEPHENKDWEGLLKAAYGIDYLYVGKKQEQHRHPDYGPPFLRAVRHLRQAGPPDYYPKTQIDTWFYHELDKLEEIYLEYRPE